VVGLLVDSSLRFASRSGIRSDIIGRCGRRFFGREPVGALALGKPAPTGPNPMMPTGTGYPRFA